MFLDPALCWDFLKHEGSFLIFHKCKDLDSNSKESDNLIQVTLSFCKVNRNKQDSRKHISSYNGTIGFIFSLDSELNNKERHNLPHETVLNSHFKWFRCSYTVTGRPIFLSD